MWWGQSWLGASVSLTCCCSVAQLCLTLCDPVECSTPGSSVLHCQEPVWGIPPVTRSWGRKLTYARRAQTSGAPLEIPKHVPQQKSAAFCALLFHSSDIFWKRSIQGFSLLHLKECFNPKTLWWLSSLPAGLVQLRLCLRPPDRRRHRKLKTS